MGKRSDKAIVVKEPERYLTDKELAFCIEYSVSGNATKSYQRAYKCGYNTARNAGCQLLQDLALMAVINEMRAERNERLKIDADDILRKLKILSEYDASDFYDDDNRLKPLSELHPDLRYCIEGMDVSEKVDGGEGDGISRLMKIKLPRKKDALEALGRHLQLFGDKQPNPAGTTPKTIRIIKAEEMTIV